MKINSQNGCYKSILSNIVFGDPDLSYGASDLFYRSRPIIDKKYNFEFRFDTWMNFFAAKKWKEYCLINDLFLSIKGKGNVCIEIHGSKKSLAFGVIDTVISSYEINLSKNYKDIEIKNAFDYDAIFFILKCKTQDVSQLSAFWSTSAMPLRNSKIAIITTTFKRENFVLKTIKKFNEFVTHNNLNGKLSLYVVDNGNSIDKNNLSSGNTSIIPNINAGGAGGFARGLLEVNKKKFDRAIFMDDDVIVNCESFFRVLKIDEFLKPEYLNSFICGSNIFATNKIFCWENLAKKNSFDMWVSPLKGYMNLDIFYNCIDIIDIDPKAFNSQIDCGWFFCSFSTSLFKDEYPMPFFIRGDDVDWGWRKKGTNYISINGVCIWHDPFLWRIDKITDYYYFVRNMFWLNLIYSPNFKNEWKSYLRRIFRKLLISYDYVSLEIMMRALSEILNGPDVFRQNPESIHKNLSNYIKSNSNIYHSNDNYAVEESKKCWDVNTACAKYKIKRMLYLFTGLGILLPKCFYSKRVGYAPKGDERLKHFILKSTVKVVNPLNNEIEVRSINKKKMVHYCITYFKFEKKLSHNFKLLKQKATNSYKELTSYKFWVKYLGLE